MARRQCYEHPPWDPPSPPWGPNSPQIDSARTIRLLREITLNHPVVGHHVSQLPIQWTDSGYREPTMFLKPMNYRPQDVLRASVNFWNVPEWKMNRTLRQMVRDRNLIPRLIEIKKPNDQTTDQLTLANLASIAEMFDRFFFNSTLMKTHWRGNRVRALNSIIHDPGISIQNDNTIDGRSKVTYATLGFGDSFDLRINMSLPEFANQTKANRGREWLVVTLLHEMCRIYLWTYSCMCSPVCQLNVANTVGFTGHGNTWVMLFGMVIGQIREWDPALRNLGKDYVDKYDIHRPAVRYEEYHYRALALDPNVRIIWKPGKGPQPGPAQTIPPWLNQWTHDNKNQEYHVVSRGDTSIAAVTNGPRHIRRLHYPTLEDMEDSD